MKQDVIIEIIRKIKAKPDLKRKVMIFLAAGAVGLLITGALVIWAGVSAFNFVASNATKVIHSPEARAQVENLKQEAKGIPKLQPLSCWLKAQSLLAVEPWLARPALDNLITLKVACLESIPAACEGGECKQNENSTNTEGETI
jgi:hypothetical protein